MQLGGSRVEFIQCVAPSSRVYHGDSSAAGVRFHTPVRTVRNPGRPVWRCWYLRDPDGICVELVESPPETLHAERVSTSDETSA